LRCYVRGDGAAPRKIVFWPHGTSWGTPLAFLLFFIPRCERDPPARAAPADLYPGTRADKVWPRGAAALCYHQSRIPVFRADPVQCRTDLIQCMSWFRRLSRPLWRPRRGTAGYNVASRWRDGWLSPDFFGRGGGRAAVSTQRATALVCCSVFSHARGPGRRHVELGVCPASLSTGGGPDVIVLDTRRIGCVTSVGCSLPARGRVSAPSASAFAGGPLPLCHAHARHDTGRLTLQAALEPLPSVPRRARHGVAGTVRDDGTAFSGAANTGRTLTWFAHNPPAWTRTLSRLSCETDVHVAPPPRNAQQHRPRSNRRSR